MRKTPLQRTPQKSRSISKSRITESMVTQRASSNMYYCHYKNAMYMGGIKSFKKDGRGILLHDCGLSVLTTYYNDLMHGHNIFFDNYSLLSAILNKNKVIEAVYRTEGFLVFLSYNQDRQLEGVSKLLNFVTRSIIYATFRKGNMVDKGEQTDQNVINRVFDHQELELLVGRTHARVMNYDFERIQNIEFQKHGNKIVVGFQKNGFINGLGFQFAFRGSQGGYNPDTQRQEDEFELKIVERGYYMNTQLNGMGEKIFKNGNFYVGEFRNGIFEGNGILKNNEKKNWVSGFFRDGNMTELLEYNSEGSGKNIERIIQALHQRKTNWINNQISLPNMSLFLNQIEKLITITPNKQVQSLAQRKLQVLKRIQNKFVTDSDEVPSEEIESSMYHLKNNIVNESDSKVMHSFGPSFENSKAESSSYNHEVNHILQAGGQLGNSDFSRGKNVQKNSRSITPNKKLNQSQRSNTKKPSGQLNSPEWIKVSDNLFSSRKTDRNVQKWKIQKNQTEQSSGLKSSGLKSSAAQPLSSDRYSGNSRSPLDSKRLVTKNKIFRYLQTKEQRRSPQFTYSKADTLRDMERQR